MSSTSIPVVSRITIIKVQVDKFMDGFEYYIKIDAGDRDVNEYIKSMDATWIKSKSEIISNQLLSDPYENSIYYYRYLFMGDSKVDYSLFIDALYTAIDMWHGFFDDYLQHLILYSKFNHKHVYIITLAY